MERASAALIARVDAARGATTAAASSKPLTIGSARGSLEEAR
jgi:hypothetical protein